MRNGALGVIAILLLGYVAPLPFRPLISPDETRYAEIPREMLASGDIVVPRFNGLRYFEKPCLGYWITATSMKLFGEGAFPVRLPTAMSAALSALLLFVLVRRFGGGYDTGLLTALTFLSSLEVYALGTFSTLDGVLSLFVTGALACFFFGYQAKRPVAAKAFLSLSGAFAGLAFLTKGFIAFAIPLTVILPFMILEGRLRHIFRVVWLPLLSAVLVILPWAVVIHLREGDYWNYFFWVEHVRRFASPRPQPFLRLGYFIPVLLVGSLPWVFLFPAALSGLRQVGRRDPLITFAWCWFLFPFLFFSLSQGKLLTYILPCYAPLAILVIRGLLSEPGVGHETAFRRSATQCAAVVGLCGVGVILAQVVGMRHLMLYDGPKEAWKWLLGVACAVIWSLLAFAAAREKDSYRRVSLYAAGPMALFLAMHFTLPMWAIEMKAPQTFLDSHRNHVSSDDVVLADPQMVGAVCWAYRRADVFLLFDCGEFDYGARYPGARDRFVDGPDKLTALIAKCAPGKRVIAIASPKRWKAWSGLLPNFKVIDDDRGTLMAELDLPGAAEHARVEAENAADAPMEEFTTLRRERAVE